MCRPAVTTTTDKLIPDEHLVRERFPTARIVSTTTTETGVQIELVDGAFVYVGRYSERGWSYVVKPKVK